MESFPGITRYGTMPRMHAEEGDDLATAAEQCNDTFTPLNLPTQVCNPSHVSSRGQIFTLRIFHNTGLSRWLIYVETHFHFLLTRHFYLADRITSLVYRSACVSTNQEALGSKVVHL